MKKSTVYIATVLVATLFSAPLYADSDASITSSFKTPGGNTITVSQVRFYIGTSTLACNQLNVTHSLNDVFVSA